MNSKWQAGWIAALMLLGVWHYLGATLRTSNPVDGGRPGQDAAGISRAGREPGVRVYKAYLEATRGHNYSVQVRNRSNERIGVVIADGRNIISGDRSNLSPSERMYVLGPYQQESYEGLADRQESGQPFLLHRRGRFLPGAWGDYSAMGVIAVAALGRTRRNNRGVRGDRLHDQRGCGDRPHRLNPPRRQSVLCRA